jgi:hypothetical protein
MFWVIICFVIAIIIGSERYPLLSIVQECSPWSDQRLTVAQQTLEARAASRAYKVCHSKLLQTAASNLQRRLGG